MDEMHLLLSAIKEVVPVPISFEQIESGAKGFFHLEEKEKKPAKKESIMDKLSKGKAKSEKTKTQKKVTDRDIRTAI